MANSTKKYSAIDMFKYAPEFEVEVSSPKITAKQLLPASFFEKCEKLFPTAGSQEVNDLKRELNEVMYEKAQKKHKNYLRRQRAKQAKAAQKEKDGMANIETSSVSGVSTNSTGSLKKNLQKNIQKPSQKNIKKSHLKPTTPEPEFKQPNFSSGFKNFQNQGKLRASSDEKSLTGASSASVFVTKPVGEPRTWSNSRLHKRQPRARIGSRS